MRNQLLHLTDSARAMMKRGAFLAAGLGAILGVLVAVGTGFKWPWEMLGAGLVWTSMLSCLGLILGGYLGIIFGADSTRSTAMRGVAWGSAIGMLLGVCGGVLIGLLTVVSPFTGTSVSSASIFVIVVSLISTLACGFIGASIGALVGILRSRAR